MYRSIKIRKRKGTSSVIEPEPDFLAGAGAGEKLRAVAVWVRGTVVAK